MLPGSRRSSQRRLCGVHHDLRHRDRNENAGAQNSGMVPTEKTADFLGQRPFGFRLFSFLSQAGSLRQAVGDSFARSARGTSPWSERQRRKQPDLSIKSGCKPRRAHARGHTPGRSAPYPPPEGDIGLNYFRERVYSERRKCLIFKGFRRFSMSVCRLFVA